MSESFEKAVEAAAEALFNRAGHVGAFDEHPLRMMYVNQSRAALHAALPHLTAQDVPHVARDAWWEGWDAETAWQDDIDHRTIPAIERRDNPYAEEDQA